MIWQSLSRVLRCNDRNMDNRDMRKGPIRDPFAFFFIVKNLESWYDNMYVIILRGMLS